MSRVVRVNSWPVRSMTEPAAKDFSRTSGPLVSSMGGHRQAQLRPQGLQGVQTTLVLRVAAVGEIEPATFMPASSICRRTPSLSVAGPRVHTIFVFLINKNPPFGQKGYKL